MFPLPPLSPEQRTIVERVSTLARETIGKVLCGKEVVVRASAPSAFGP